MRRAASSGPILSRTLFVLLLLVLSFHAAPSQAAERRATVEDEIPSPFKLGVVLNEGSTLAIMSRLCMDMAISDFYRAHANYTTRLDLRFRATQRDPVSAASAAADLMANERVHAIIGPQTSDEAAFVALLGNDTKVPVISFSATSPSVSPKKTRFFVRTAVNDSSQANSTAALVNFFGWMQIVPIYEQSVYGTGMIAYIVDAIKAAGVRVPYSVTIPPSASEDLISKELYKLMNKECRVFLVHMTKSLALRFFSKVNDAGMMSEGFAWILSEGLTSLLGTVDPSVLREDFYGVVGMKPYVSESDKLQDFRKRWLRESRKENPESDLSDLTVMGLWAYDTVWALAMAAESVGAGDPGFSEPQSLRELTDLSSIGISTTGERLLDATLATEFPGLSGHFRLVGGQLDRPVFEIVNAVGMSLRTIGYWTEDGLQRQPYRRSPKASRSRLSSVIWPGDTTAVPKGWIYPLIGKKLKILVPGPVDPGFHSFLKADINPETKKLEVGGFVIEVFESALKQLPYAVSVEYFQRPKDKPKPTYDELVRMVLEQSYDGLVGDVTITANRSNYADFTLPYTTTGVSMVVPLKDDRRMSAWFFHKPLSPKLWFVSGCFFVFTGLVVWILEHQVNDEFRGRLGHQVGTASYFIFSTLVFSLKEEMKSNLSKVVVIIWIFVVLVLQSSYTASLTSMLTVKHLRPTTVEFQDLINRGEYVGYLRSSFTKRLLLKEGFKEEKLRPYKSPQEYLEALNKGSGNGGVGAIIDEIPYLRLFLKDYCKNYTMAGSSYKAGGFGFVFPRGSPLVPDLSKAILIMGEGDRMTEIEKRWFGDLSNCATEENTLTSDRLTVANFWGLFLITGVASGLALLGFLFSFLRQHRHVLRGTDAGETFREILMKLGKHYIEKDSNSHTFRRRAKDKGDPLVSPCDCGRSSRDSVFSTFIGRLGNGTGSAYTSGCPTPSINLGPANGENQGADLASPLERGALSSGEPLGESPTRQALQES